jgi:hypothetical protein
MTNKHHFAILGVLALVGLSLGISYRPAKVSAQNSWGLRPRLYAVARFAD